MASHAAVADPVVPVVAAARGTGVTRSALSPSAARGVVAAVPVSLPRPAVSGVVKNAEQRAFASASRTLPERRPRVPSGCFAGERHSRRR